VKKPLITLPYLSKFGILKAAPVVLIKDIMVEADGQSHIEYTLANARLLSDSEWQHRFRDAPASMVK
jgi:hypothetical protein